MLKKLSQSIGLASLILVMNYGDLLGGGYDVRMHVPFALTGIVLAQLADILLLGLLIFAVLAPLSRTRVYPWVRLLLAILAPPYLLMRIRAELPVRLTSGLLIVLTITWAAIVLLLLLRSPERYRTLIRAGEFLSVFLAIFAACSIVQLLYVLRWKPGSYQKTAAWAGTPQPPRQHPLLVWIVFDELSYDQVFEHRAHDLLLPNFDALRDQSTVFTNAQPIGIRTVKVLPSLLTGHIVDAYDFTFDNRLVVHDAGQHGFHHLDGSQTVFGDAQRSGWRTAAVGWYNPYCTLYADALDNCYWMNLDRADGPMAQTASFWRNAWTPLRQAGRELISPAQASRDLCTYDIRQRSLTHVQLEQHLQQLLHTDQADFVFLHLPIPHSPNIWSRMRGGYTQQCGSSYLDSLALADRELGGVLSTLQSSPRWKDTTLIVEGDHSWRINLWNDQPGWTSEDDAASHEQFDPRPGLIIHTAGQTQPEVNATAWSLLNVHSVVEQVVRGEAVDY